MRLSLIVRSICCLLVAGCTATGPHHADPSPTPAVQEQAPAPAPPPPPVEFVTKVDTVDAARTEEPAPADSVLASDEARFCVQVGAFREPQNAGAAQANARERYGLPVRNEFNERAGLYQIRIGAFLTRDEARALLLRMQAEHPADYRDSFIIQGKR